MQNQLRVKFLNPNEGSYGEGAEFALMLGEKHLATMTVSFTDKKDISTPEDFKTHVKVAEECHELSPLYASSVILSTIMSNWHLGADSFESIFENGDLEVEVKNV